jgi:hypothetical protein
MRHVEVQISATIHLPRGYAPTKQIVEDAIKYRLKNDEDPHGVTLRITGWNSSTKNGTHERELDEDEDDSRHWHNFRGLLQAASFSIRANWSNKRESK